jgi:purine-cytosine permease-like protein
MGYWPSKITCLLNIIQQLGWGIIGSIISGQMISAVNGAGLSITVGCVISALCIGLIAAFGIAILHTYERCAPLLTLPLSLEDERNPTLTTG